LLTVFLARLNYRAARRTRAYSSTVFIPPVSHRKHDPYELKNASGTPKRTYLSVKLLPGGVDYFYSATNQRSRAASWSIFAPPCIGGFDSDPRLPRGLTPGSAQVPQIFHGPKIAVAWSLSHVLKSTQVSRNSARLPRWGDGIERIASREWGMPMHVPKDWCEDHFHTIDPKTNAKGIHIWPFNPSFPIDVRFLTSGRSPKVRMNRHDYFEVLIVLSGVAELRIQDRILSFHQGDAAIVGSSLYHSLGPHEGLKFTVAALFFLPELIRGDGGRESDGYLTPFLQQDAQFPHVIAGKTGVPSKILDLMQRIRAELPAITPLARLAARTYLMLILLLLAQEYSFYGGSVRTYERRQNALTRLQPLFSYVESHFNEKIQVGRAARVCAMSESHFINFFKDTTGQSFVSYLNHYRVERAQQLLASTDRSLTDIGVEVGFCDQSYFGMVFRRFAGMTPSSYRRQFTEYAAQPSAIKGQILTVPTPNSARAAEVGPLMRESA